MADFKKVADASDLSPGTSICVELDGEKVALFNVAGTVHAISDTCTHVGGPLSSGQVLESTVTCPLHGSVFDLTSGQVLGPPASSPVTCYQVRVEGNEIQVAAP